MAFLAMELLEGTDLRKRVQQGPIPPIEAVEIACQVAEGLAYAHGRGIVHRDIKPGEHHAARARAGEDHGLRPRAHAPRRPQDEHRHRARHAALHVAGADLGPAGRPPLRHLLARHRAVGDAHRQAPVQRHRDGAGEPQHHLRRARAADARQSRAAGDARLRGGARAEEGSGGALPGRRRDGGRPAHLPRRAASGAKAKSRSRAAARRRSSTPMASRRSSRRPRRPSLTDTRLPVSRHFDSAAALKRLGRSARTGRAPRPVGVLRRIISDAPARRLFVVTLLAAAAGSFIALRTSSLRR